MEIVDPDTPDLALLSYDPATAHPRFAEQIRDHDERLIGRQYMVTLKNRSEQPIKALTVAWSVTTDSGVSETRYTRFDKFNPLGSISRYTIPEDAYLAGARSEGLIYPSGFLSADWLEAVRKAGRGTWMALSPIFQIAELDSASRVTISLDTVVFKDGRIWGADQSKTVESVQAIDSALRILQEGVLDARRARQNIVALLAALSSPAVSNQWVSQFAYQLYKMGSLRKIALEKLENLQPLPPFTRNR